MPESLTLDEKFFDNLWPFYNQLRESGPIHRITLPNGLAAWLVIDYELGKKVLADPRLSKDEVSSGAAARRQGIAAGWQQAAGPRPLRVNLLNTDPPDHTRLRSLVNKAFTPSASAHMRPAIESIAAKLIGDLQSLDDHQRVDLLDSYATPLPIAVICSLLGIPAEDQDTFGELIITIMDETAVADGEKSRQARVQLNKYLTTLVTDRRAQRGQHDADSDLLDRLITAQVDHDRLSDEEVVATIGLLLVAGYDTTVHLIANAIFLLATQPAVLERARNNTHEIAKLIEEVLRWEGPGHAATLRHTTSPITLGDTQIEAGEFLIVSVAAANRDPSVFPNPDQFQFDRNDAHHLSFGHGIHYCVGAPLARLEAEIALRALVTAFPIFTLAADPDTLRWRHSMIIRGRTTLPIDLHQSAT